MAFVRLWGCSSEQEHREEVVPLSGRSADVRHDPLFRESHLFFRRDSYEPVDSESLLYYHEAKDGQILEEGINGGGAMSSFIAAGTAYRPGEPMIHSYIYYSMFGFQRIGDLLGAGISGRRVHARRDCGADDAQREGCSMKTGTATPGQHGPQSVNSIRVRVRDRDLYRTLGGCTAKGRVFYYLTLL